MLSATKNVLNCSVALAIAALRLAYLPTKHYFFLWFGYLHSTFVNVFLYCFAPLFRVSSDLKLVNRKLVFTLSSGLLFSLHGQDLHESCSICLGILYIRRMLSELDKWKFYFYLRLSTLKRRMMFTQQLLGAAAVMQQDQMLPEGPFPASPGSNEDSLLIEGY